MPRTYACCRISSATSRLPTRRSRKARKRARFSTSVASAPAASDARAPGGRAASPPLSSAAAGVADGAVAVIAGAVISGLRRLIVWVHVAARRKVAAAELAFGRAGWCSFGHDGLLSPLLTDDGRGDYRRYACVVIAAGMWVLALALDGGVGASAGAAAAAPALVPPPAAAASLLTRARAAAVWAARGVPSTGPAQAIGSCSRGCLQ